MNSTEVCTDTVGSTSLNLLQAEPASLTTAVEHAAEILRSLTENELQKRYELGALVRQEQEHAEYGDRAVKAFEEALHLNANTLMAHVAVTRAWHEEAFTELTTRRGGEARAFRLSWSHLVLLAGVGDVAIREQLTELALSEGLSEKKLRAEKSRLLPRKSKSSKSRESGAGVETPSAMLAMARQLKEKLETVIDDLTPEHTREFFASEETLSQLEALIVAARHQVKASQRATAPMTEAIALLQLPANATSHPDDVAFVA